MKKEKTPKSEKEKKVILKREGFFSSFHKYNNNDNYNKRKKELEEEDIHLEKKDPLALFISGFLVIFLPCILILGLTVFLTLLIMGFFR